jgi:hypothetical protein
MKMSFFVDGFFFDFLSAASLASAARLSLSHKDMLLAELLDLDVILGDTAARTYTQEREAEPAGIRG